MKRIVIVHSSMELGGAETSLIGLLHSFDYSRYAVDLLLLSPKGDLMKFIPEKVHILETPKCYTQLVKPVRQVIQECGFGVALARIAGKLLGRKYPSRTYVTKQYSHLLAKPFLKRIPGVYDLAISFIDPHYIVQSKISARLKLGWLHTDFSRVALNVKQDQHMWDQCDYIVNVSDSCKQSFDVVYAALQQKSIVVENILSARLIAAQAEAPVPAEEMPAKGIRLLSIGRYCTAKNFDNVPDICARLIQAGLDVYWYIIGFGGQEQLIRDKIAEAHMEDRVILLGKKENPYPYIKACDLYVQPSRYEGKCVSVREAQILGKPVVITNYATAASQLTDGVDGIIVPMDNEGCASGIAALLKDPDRMARLAENCGQRDYTNAGEIEKIYSLLR